jgi:hypothetical protein
MSSNGKESKEPNDEATSDSDASVMVEVGKVSDTKGGFGPYPDAGIGGSFDGIV